MFDVTNVDKVKLAKKVYELSVPKGMGFLHAASGPLSDEEAKEFIRDDGTVHMDYVKGRACKFHVSLRDDKLTISDNWYDHTDQQLRELLRHVGIMPDMPRDDHIGACECVDCLKRRPLSARK